MRLLIVFILLIAATISWPQSMKAGDSIRLSSPWAVELNDELPVNADGAIWLPGGAKVDAGGREFEEVRSAVIRLLNRSGADTRGLRIVKGRRSSNKVSFFGAIENPGSIQFKPGLRMRDVLAIAIPIHGADLDSVSIEDVQGVSRIVSVELDPRKDSDLGIPLREGDAIFIPLSQVSSDVAVLGEVGTPGKVEFFVGLTALKAIGLAGGMTGNADRSRIEVRRAGQPTQYVNAELNYDVALRKGDVIVVSIVDAPKYFYVTGAVGKPGRYAFESGLRLTRALLLAGGTIPLLTIDEIVILRRVSGSLKRLRFSLSKIQQRIEPNPILEPGDSIEVLAKSRGVRQGP